MSASGVADVAGAVGAALGKGGSSANVPTPTDDLSAAAARIRETAKWLITTFAAVGGVLLAGTQFSTVGSLTGWRLCLAIIVALAAITAIAYAIGAAASVATAGEVGLQKLSSSTTFKTERDDINDDKPLLAGYKDVAELTDQYTTLLANRKADFDKYYEDVGNSDSKLKAEASNARVLAVDQAARRVVSVASFDALSIAYARARRKMFGAALVAAVAVIAFVVLSQAKTEPQLFPATAALVTLALDKDGQEALSTGGGPSCAASTVRAIVLGTTGGNMDVVTLPTANCAAVRLTVPADLAKVSP